MDAKLEAEQKENPPLCLRFECKICKIEFTRTLFYDKNRQEYIKFRDLRNKIENMAQDNEELEELVFVDICNECRNK